MNNLYLLSIVLFVAMLSPGPDFILVTRNALKYPMKQALATAFGIVAGCLVHATYCILGLAIIITKSIILFSTIKYAGACYLIYIGLKGVFSKPSNTSIQTIEKSLTNDKSVWAAFVEGFLCNVLNPKLAVFLLSLFTQFISVNATISEKAIVSGIFVTESLVYWPFLVLLLQTKFIQSAFHQLQVYVDRICGALLVGLGLKVALSRD